MKKTKKIYSFSILMRNILVCVSAVLNIYGIFLMTKGVFGWTNYIIYSIYALGFVMFFYLTHGFAKRSILNKSLYLFLTENNLLDSEVIKKTEERILIKNGDDFLTIEMYIKKDGVGFIMAPAQVEWDATVINWDNKSEKAKVSFMPSWEEPEWYKDTTEETKENEEILIKEDTDNE